MFEIMNRVAARQNGTITPVDSRTGKMNLLKIGSSEQLEGRSRARWDLEREQDWMCQRREHR